MAVLLHVKDAKHFAAQVEDGELALIPGKMYLNLYKNIPHHDLELLFPNLKISMNLKDKLMLAVPAFGAAVPLALKVLPSIGLLIGRLRSSYSGGSWVVISRLLIQTRRQFMHC